MKTAIGIALMFFGYLGSTIMCDRDLCPFKKNNTICCVNTACVIAYAIGLHLLMVSL